MRVTIPKQGVNLQVMVDSFNLLGRLARRDRRLITNITVIYAELDDFLRRLNGRLKVLIVDV